LRCDYHNNAPNVAAAILQTLTLVIVGIGQNHATVYAYVAAEMLTPKQARFVEEYLRDLNATQAAIRAGFSERTANQQGPRLLENAEVLSAIDAAKFQRSIETGIDSRGLLRRLVDEAEADLADLFDGKNNFKSVEDWPPIWRQGLVQCVEIEALYDGQGKDRIQIGEVKKVRLSDRVRRLELIGKHVKVNAFQENVHHTGLDALGDRLERAFKRLETDAPRTIEIQASASDAPGAASDQNGDAALQRAADSARRYLEAEKQFTRPASAAQPSSSPKPSRRT
jgi:phage terminase small subunit